MLLINSKFKAKMKAEQHQILWISTGGRKHSFIPNMSPYLIF